MVKGMRQETGQRVIEDELNRLFPAEWLRKTAKDTGMVKRERKIDPPLLFWVLVLGFGVQFQRTLASLRRLYEETGEVRISRGIFYERFTPELVGFLHACVLHGLENITRGPNRVLKEKLAGFEDLVTQDSLIISLHEKLADKWPATRTRKVAAGVKVSMLVSAVPDGPRHVALHAERTSEVKTLKIGPWVRNRIRLKGSADPLITGVNLTWRGNTIDVLGKHLSEVLPKLKREVLDVNVEILFRRRKYNGKQRDTSQFRLVAMFNTEEKKYHVYLTNITTDTLDARDIAALYSARWEIELIFKELKSRYGIDILPTSNPQVVKALVWVGILTLIVSRRVYPLVFSSNLENAPRYTHMRWTTIFAEKSHCFFLSTQEA